MARTYAASAGIVDLHKVAESSQVGAAFAFVTRNEAHTHCVRIDHHEDARSSRLANETSIPQHYRKGPSVSTG